MIFQLTIELDKDDHNYIKVLNIARIDKSIDKKQVVKDGEKENKAASKYSKDTKC